MVKKYFHFFTILVILIISAYYIQQHKAEFIVLNNISGLYIALLVLLMMGVFGTAGYSFKLLVSLHQVHLTLTETFGLSVLTNFANYIGPTGPGLVFKALYLKSTRGLLYSNFTTVIMANFIIMLFLQGVFGLILIFLSHRENMAFPVFLPLICLGLVIVSLLPFIFKLPVLRTKGRITRFLQSSVQGFDIIRSQKNKLLLICLSFLLQYINSAILTMVVYDSIGYPITFLTALTIGVLTSIVNIIHITPNNFGIQAIALAYLVSLTGLDFTHGIIGAGIIRAFNLGSTFILAPIFSIGLLKPKGIPMWPKS